MNKPTAFVITHEPDTARTQRNSLLSIIAITLTRSLGRRGIKVVRIHPNRLDYSLRSKYCSAVEISPNQYSSEEALVEFLQGLAEKYKGPKVLIPASDDCSLFLAKHEVALNKHFSILNPSAQSMENMKNKRLQYELADNLGVPIPETYFTATKEDLGTVAKKAINFPYVIKPLEAQKWRLKEFKEASQGKKAFTVNNREELIAELERIGALDTKLMVQEVLTGPDTHLYTFLGYCSRKEGLLAYCIRSKLRQYPVDFGYCTATISCHNTEVEQYAKKILQQVEYSGIVGIEFKFDEKTGLHKLIEINTRPVNTTGLSIGCGVDLPYIAYCDAAGLEGPKPKDWQDGVKWVWLFQDFWAARELVAKGRLTWKEWRKSLSGRRVHAIFAKDDILPFALYYGNWLKKWLKKS